MASSAFGGLAEAAQNRLAWVVISHAPARRLPSVDLQADCATDQFAGYVSLGSSASGQSGWAGTGAAAAKITGPQ